MLCGRGLPDGVTGGNEDISGTGDALGLRFCSWVNAGCSKRMPAGASYRPPGVECRAKLDAETGTSRGLLLGSDVLVLHKSTRSCTLLVRPLGRILLFRALGSRTETLVRVASSGSRCSSSLLEDSAGAGLMSCLGSTGLQLSVSPVCLGDVRIGTGDLRTPGVAGKGRELRNMDPELVLSPGNGEGGRNLALAASSKSGVGARRGGKAGFGEGDRFAKVMGFDGVARLSGRVPIALGPFNDDFAAGPGCGGEMSFMSSSASPVNQSCC
jgi:hypothetical protein